MQIETGLVRFAIPDTLLIEIYTFSHRTIGHMISIFFICSTNKSNFLYSNSFDSGGFLYQKYTLPLWEATDPFDPFYFFQLF